MMAKKEKQVNMRYSISDIKTGFTFWLKGEKLSVRKIDPWTECSMGGCNVQMAHITTLDGVGRGQIELDRLIEISNKYELTFEDLYNRFPLELRNSLATCEQDPVYHPEGVCENHIRQVFELAKQYNNDQLLLCALFHDLGKPETKQVKTRDNGTLKISNIGHENRAQYYIDKYLHLFEDLKPNKELVSEVCFYHMRVHLYIDGTIKKASKRQAMEELTYFKELIQFSECDDKGRIKLTK